MLNEFSSCYFAALCTVSRKLLRTLLQAAAPCKCTTHELLMLFACIGTTHQWNQKRVAVLAEVILQDVQAYVTLPCRLLLHVKMHEQPCSHAHLSGSIHLVYML